MLQLKTDADGLPPKYAEDLKKISLELYSGTATDPQKAARERNSLLEAIRKQPGLQYFLRPKPYSVLSGASQGGPVIILNSHTDSCDAVIILNPTADPVHVSLPNVTLHLLRSQQRVLKELLGHCNVRTREQSVATRLFGGRENFMSRSTKECFADMLTWLWTNVVNPVYQVLGSVSVNISSIGV
jgi:hypothetical protein